jgi:hypothetical protein
MQLTDDWLSAYYRDDAILLSITAKDLMFAASAKRDPFQEVTIFTSEFVMRTNQDSSSILCHRMQAIPTTASRWGFLISNTAKWNWKKIPLWFVLGDASSRRRSGRGFSMAR